MADEFRRPRACYFLAAASAIGPHLLLVGRVGVYQVDIKVLGILRLHLLNRCENGGRLFDPVGELEALCLGGLSKSDSTASVDGLRLFRRWQRSRPLRALPQVQA